MTKKSDTDFLSTLENGVRAVLTNEKSTAKERIEAINAGAKLMQIKHRISDGNEDPGSFFKKG